MNSIFPYIGNVIIPTDFHIFQRGRYTTNQTELDCVNGAGANYSNLTCRPVHLPGMIWDDGDNCNQ